jgi:hypothetical protein
MATKKPAKETGAIKAPKPRPVVVFDFGDAGKGKLPLADMEKQLVRQYARMEASDDPVLREIGGRKLAEVAERLVTQTTRKIGSSTGGSNKPEPAWHEPCAKYARLLLATGVGGHELVGKLKRRFKYGDKAIREALKNKGVK